MTFSTCPSSKIQVIPDPPPNRKFNNKTYLGHVFSRLNNDAVNHILGFTDISTLGKVCLLSKSWRDLMQLNRSTAYPWKYILEREKKKCLSPLFAASIQIYGRLDLKFLDSETGLDKEINRLHQVLQLNLAGAYQILHNEHRILYPRKICALSTTFFIISGGVVWLISRHSQMGYDIKQSISMSLVYSILMTIVLSYAYHLCNAPMTSNEDYAQHQYQKLQKDHPIKIYEKIFQTTIFQDQQSLNALEGCDVHYIRLKKSKELNVLRKIVEMDHIIVAP